MRLTLITFILFVGFASACNKEEQKMEIVRDCTGVYLRSNSGKEYFVCNEALIESYNTGTKIKVEFDILENCFGLIEPPSCSETHVFEDKIEITKVL